MYLTTTDYVQHKYAPGVPQANAFYAMFDRYLGELDALGAAIVVTADHGMKPKHKADGSPDVVYAQDLFDDWLGKDAARVILPITDPYVVHHGALGSFATAYLPDGADRAGIIARLRGVEGITLVVDREEAVRRFELPADRIGDLVMISGENKTIGTSGAPPRPRGARRALALARRADRAGGAVHRQPGAAGAAGRARLAQLRRLLLRRDGRGGAGRGARAMTRVETKLAVRHEPMRIAGEKVEADGVVEVRYPYTDTVIGTVPAGRAEHARRAFAIAAGYTPTLSRYERQQILFRTAEALAARKEAVSDLITLELGISKADSLYEVGRAFDVFTLAAQMCIQDDGQIFSCDLTPHGKARKIFTLREPLARDLGDHPVQPSLEHGRAQGRPGDRHQQLRGGQADRADADDGTRARRHPLRGRAAAGDAVGGHRLAERHRRRDDHQPGDRARHLHRRRAGRQADRVARPATSARCSSSAATTR